MASQQGWNVFPNLLTQSRHKCSERPSGADGSHPWSGLGWWEVTLPVEREELEGPFQPNQFHGSVTIWAGGTFSFKKKYKYIFLIKNLCSQDRDGPELKAEVSEVDFWDLPT